MAESVAIVLLNILTTIVFIKNRSLRKRSMYLVINLAVADMLVGGCSEIARFVKLGRSCSFWNTQRLPPLVSVYILHLFYAVSLTNLAAIRLERMHATFRPFRHRIIKKRVFGFIITIIWVTTGVLIIATYYLLSNQAMYWFIDGFLYIYYLCFLRVYCCQVFLWNSSSAPWCSRQRGETNQDIVDCDCVYAIKMPDFKRALVSLFRRQQRQVDVIPLGPL